MGRSQCQQCRRPRGPGTPSRSGQSRFHLPRHSPVASACAYAEIQRFAGEPDSPGGAAHGRVHGRVTQIASDSEDRRADAETSNTDSDAGRTLLVTHRVRRRIVSSRQQPIRSNIDSSGISSDTRRVGRFGSPSHDDEARREEELRLGSVGIRVTLRSDLMQGQVRRDPEPAAGRRSSGAIHRVGSSAGRGLSIPVSGLAKPGPREDTMPTTPTRRRVSEPDPSVIAAPR
jgi:hypothetical protein